MFREQQKQSPNNQLDDDLIFENVIFSEDLAQESLPEGSTFSESSESSEEEHLELEGDKSQANRGNKLKSSTTPIKIVSKSQKKNSQNKKTIFLPEVKNKNPENIVFQIKSTETVANEPANKPLSCTDKKEEWSFDNLLFSTSPSSRPECLTVNVDPTPAKSTGTSIDIPKKGNKYNKYPLSVEGDIYRKSLSSYEVNKNKMINAIKRYIKNRTDKPEEQVVKHLKSFFGVPTQSEKLKAANALIGYLNNEISYDQLRAYEKDFQPSTELGKIYTYGMSKKLIISPSNSPTF